MCSCCCSELGVVPGDVNRVYEAAGTLTWGLEDTEEEGNSFPAEAGLGRAAVSFHRQRNQERNSVSWADYLSKWEPGPETQKPQCCCPHWG